MLTINYTTLPTDVQDKVKEDLYMYDKTYITRENGKYTASPHTILDTRVKADDFTVFTPITRDDVYTKEEQAENRRIFNEETKNMDWEWFGA